MELFVIFELMSKGILILLLFFCGYFILRIFGCIFGFNRRAKWESAGDEFEDRQDEIVSILSSLAHQSYGAREVIPITESVKLICVTSRRRFVFCTVDIQSEEHKDFAQSIALRLRGLLLADIIIVQCGERVISKRLTRTS